MKRPFWCLWLLLLPILSFGQRERITSYHTDLALDANRSVILTETITVYALGQKIKRGISRNFPAYRKLKHARVRMNYDILEIKKDGKAEPYHKERVNDDEVLYIGSKDVFLTPGSYVYTIKYSVPNQISFYEEFDEIYWNVIGHDVELSVDSASCTVHLPSKALMIQEASYVGSYGTKGNEFVLNQAGNELHYTLTKSLAPREGFTVAIGFQKGFFQAPGFFQKYGTLLLILLGLVLLIPYYITTWFKYGQDPPTPASYPLWEAPDNLSPASLNYIQNGNYTNASFISSIIHLAIEGYLKIEETVKDGFFTSSKTYTLNKLKPEDKQLPQEERKLMKSLFGSSTTITIDGKYSAHFDSCMQSFKADLSFQHNDFIQEGNNTRLLTIPILLTIVVGVIAVIVLFNSPYAEWINIKALLIFAPVALLGLFLYGYLIKQPTVKKLDLRSRIKGYKQYLQLAEGDRLQLLNPPELTPSHFEAALPYAFALGVQHDWSEIFKSILVAAQYHPHWSNTADVHSFNRNFGGDFSKTVSGSSTKPSSSGGGSGGGGFSGGGGGGGGVGGW